MERLMGRKLVSSDEATLTKKQHRRPCSDCPWSRLALPGWLGGSTVEQWIAEAHGETRINCHTLKGPQCAGSAIYRANVCKLPRDPEILRIKADRETVFATPKEFKEHHER